MGSDMFRATLRISLIAKGPVTHFFNWAKKRRRELLVKRAAAERDGHAHFGATFLSDLVGYKAAEIMADISGLLATGEFERKWASVWQLVGGVNIQDARVLIISL
eukprot:9416581-Pyramimonas_sp.AAC.1